jgi:hypothetical protein
MNEKHVSLAGYICHFVGSVQVMKKEDLFGFCERKFKWMTKDDFENVLKLVQEQCAITGITGVYVYKTSIHSTKTHEEIMSVVRQSPSQHHSHPPE